MLSDEEKKAIEECENFLKEKSSSYINYYNDEGNQRTFWFSNLKEALNLIEKQQKEIEELKEDNEHQWEERCKLTFELENSISNDKIKAKIEELDKQEEDLQNSISDEEREEYSDANISWELMDIQIRREVLQSLLEKE